VVDVVKGALALVLVAAAAHLAWSSARRWAWRRSWLPLALRWTVLGLTALLLFHPPLVTTRELVHKPALLLLVDTSASMSLPAGEGTTGTRADAARRRHDALERRYADAFRVVTMPFAETADEGSLDGRPFGEGTDMGAAVRRAVATRAVEQVRAVFLIGDGRATRGEDARIWARQSTVPIHTVRVGPLAMDPTDVAVESFEAPEVAFRDGDVTFTVRLSARGPAAALDKRVPVVLYEGADEVAREVVSPGRQTELELHHRPLHSGFVAYGVKVGSLDGELTDVNNQTATAVMVEDEPRRVLLCSGAPSAELGFFRRSMAGDPRFRVDARVTGRKGERVPVGPADLSTAALVVIHGFTLDAYDSAVLVALADYVRSGGALLFIGNGVRQAVDGLASPLGDLLPFGKVAEKRVLTARSLPALDETYQFHPLVRILSHPQANLQAWRNVPPLLPGAVVDTTGRGGFTLFSYVSREGRVPGLMYRTFGAGVLVYLNGEETWRWKLAVGLAATKVDVYGGLFHNIVGWSADRRRGGGRTLVTSRLRYQVGEPVTTVLEDYRGVLPTGQGALVLHGAYEDDAGRPGPAFTVPLQPTNVGWRADVTPTRPGRLRLTFRAPDGTETVRRLMVVRRGEEFREPAADGRLLADVATFSSGHALGPHDSPLAIDLNDRPVVEILRTSIFWLDEPIVLFLLLLLLCAEWTLRRLFMRV